MWPDRVSNPGPPTYESDALPIALRGPASNVRYQSHFEILKESPRSLTASKAGNLAYSLAALILNYRIYSAIRRGFHPLE